MSLYEVTRKCTTQTVCFVEASSKAEAIKKVKMNGIHHYTWSLIDYDQAYFAENQNRTQKVREK